MIRDIPLYLSMSTLSADCPLPSWESTQLTLTLTNILLYCLYTLEQRTGERRMSKYGIDHAFSS